MPATPTHDEYSHLLVELFDEEEALAGARFYRALSTLELARAEEKGLYDTLEGPGVTKLRTQQAEVVEQRVAAVRSAAQHALRVLCG